MSLQEKLEPLFQKNFEEFEELGAALSIWKDGEEIVSLSGGWTNKEKETKWGADTLVPIWSATKVPAAVATLLALNEAGISPRAKVSTLWPELKAASESSLTFLQLLSHQSGLAAMSPDNRPDILNHPAVTAALESQVPFWPPGKQHGYHPRTLGFLVEEIVRRCQDGVTLGEFWRTRVAKPLDLDIWIGNLTAEAMSRVAKMYPPRIQRPSPSELDFYRALGDSNSLSLAAFSSPGGMRALNDINRPEYLQAGIPSLGGVSSASSLARFYQHLLPTENPEDEIIPGSTRDYLRKPLVNGDDLTLLLPTSFSAGCMMDPLDEDGKKIRSLFGPSTSAFGQPGAGGSHAFADPENGISFAYVMNQMESGILPNRKSLHLIEALYENL